MSLIKNVQSIRNCLFKISQNYFFLDRFFLLTYLEIQINTSTTKWTASIKIWVRTRKRSSPAWYKFEIVVAEVFHILHIPLLRLVKKLFLKVNEMNIKKYTKMLRINRKRVYENSCNIFFFLEFFPFLIFKISHLFCTKQSDEKLRCKR